MKGLQPEQRWVNIKYTPDFKVLVAQSCPTLCDPSLLGSSVHGFSQQGYWSGMPFPPPGNLPDPGIEPGSPALQADSLLSETQGSPLQRLSTAPQKRI